MRVRDSILAGAGVVAGLTLASRAVGFVRWLAQAWALGATNFASAYVTANTVPNILFEILAGGALVGAIVPVLAGPVLRGKRQTISQIASALMTWVIIVGVIAALALIAAAGWIAPFLVGPSKASPLAPTTALFLRLFAIQIPFYGMGVVAGAVLQSHRRFTWQALAPLLSSVTVIATYVLFGLMEGPPGVSWPATASIWILALGTTLGVVALSLPLIPRIRALGIELRPALTMPSGYGTAMRSLALSGIVALVAQQLAVLAIIMLANSSGYAGTIAIYQYSQAVYLLPMGIAIVPLATSVLPRLAALYSDDDGRAFEHLSSQTLRATAILAGLGTAALFVVANLTEALFSMRGQIHYMRETILALAIGLTGQALLYTLGRTLWIMGYPGWSAFGQATGWLSGIALAYPATYLGNFGAATPVAIAACVSLGLYAGAAILTAAFLKTGNGGALLGLGRTLVGVGSVTLVSILPGLILSTTTAPAHATTWALIGRTAVGTLVTGAIYLLAFYPSIKNLMKLLGAHDKTQASGHGDTGGDGGAGGAEGSGSGGMRGAGRNNRGRQT